VERSATPVGGTEMVSISIKDDAAVFEVRGLHKLWAFKSRLEIPLAHITEVRADPDHLSGVWKGFRFPGTYLPGILTAGTFYKNGKRFFWDVRNDRNAIVVVLTDEPYQELILEVDDPSAEIARLHPRQRDSS
jgi:hypothetical protein